jgi:hypothetical protein
MIANPTSSLWQEELLHALGDTLATNHTQPSDPALILLQGVRGALSNQHFEMNSTSTAPAGIFCMPVNSQCQVGWQHMLKGRFSHHWTQIQGQHIDDILR